MHCIHWFDVKEYMVIIKETEVLSTLQTGIHMLWWHVCQSRGQSAPEWYIHTQSQLTTVGFIEMQEPHLWLDWRFQLCQNFNYRTGNTWQQKLQLSNEYLSHVSVFDTQGWDSEVCQNFNDMPATAATFLGISKRKSHILTEVLIIAYTDFIAKWDGKCAVLDLL